MEIAPFLILLAVTIATFVLLLVMGGRESAVVPGAGRAAEIVAAGMVAINVSGVVGLAWFATDMFTYDGMMVFEFTLCAGLAGLLVLITAVGFTLGRHGHTKSALVLLALGTLPTLLVYGFLIYLSANPIDWK